MDRERWWGFAGGGKLWTEALATARSAHDDEQIAGIEFSEAQLFSRQNRFAEAEELLRDGQVHAEATHDRYLIDYGLSTLSICLIDQAKFEDALPLLQKVYETADSKEGDIAFGALSNMGWCLYRLGEFDRSLAVLQKIEAAGARGGTATIPQEVYGHIGNVYSSRQGFPDGSRLLHESSQAGRATGRKSICVQMARKSRECCDSDQRLGGRRNLQPPGSGTRQKIGDKTSELHDLCDSAEILKGRGDMPGAVKLFEEVSKAQIDDRVPALLSHAGLARLYSDQGQDALADREYQAALNIVEDRRSLLKQDEFKLSFLSVRISVHQNYIDFLMSHGKNQRALEIAEASRARILQGRLGQRQPDTRVQCRSLPAARP